MREQPHGCSKTSFSNDVAWCIHIYHPDLFSIVPFGFGLMVAVLLAAQASTTTSMSSVDGMIGVSTEAGGKVFDPLGLAELHAINPLVNPHPKV